MRKTISIRSEKFGEDSSVGSAAPISQPGVLADLLKRINEAADVPFEQAISLPPDAYNAPALLDLELQAIFQKGWTWIGREDEIPRPGDYLTFEIAGQPIVAIRQKNGEIRTFLNICLHRMATLVDGAGHCEGTLVCPYHAWSYSIDGKLMASPFSQAATDCAEGRSLRELPTELWEGWICTSLDARPEPFGPQLEGLSRLLEKFRMDQYVHVVRKDEIWDVNWKMLAENFMESYHLFKVHATSLEPHMPTRSTYCIPGEDAYTIHFVRASPEALYGVAHPDKEGLEEDDRNLIFDFCAFPTNLVAGAHDFLWWMSLQPCGVDRVHARWGVSYSPEIMAGVTDLAAFRAETEAVFDAANDEDKLALARVAKGSRGPLTQSGPLAQMERPLWEFARYLNKTYRAAMAK